LNAGNTCFANSSLQSLLATTAFRSIVMKGMKKSVKLSPGKVKNLKTPERRSLRNKTKVTEWLVNELSTLKAEVDKGRGKAADASRITRNIEKLSPCMTSGRQEDAHEFILAVLNSLSLEGSNRTLRELFDGKMESCVTCQSCGNCSKREERFTDLSLEISSTDVNSVLSALDAFLEEEDLGEDNLVECVRCKKKRMVTKGLKLTETLPKILTFHLKRFEYDRFGR